MRQVHLFVLSLMIFLELDYIMLIRVNTSQTFTLKLTQNSTGGYGVGINTIHNGDDDAISVYWPGGVVPDVTTTADKTDIYSFKIFDG